jgi:phosphomannomutase
MNNLIESPWKPCDLRGVYPATVSEDLLRRVGAAIGSEMEPGERVVVAGDFRLSTLSLKSALIDGLLGVGLHALDCGQVPTPLAYFHAAESRAGGVLIVTASHNPAAYNGLKWMTNGQPPTPEAMARVRNAAEARRFRTGLGLLERVDPLPAYRRWIQSRWDGLVGSRIGRLVVDPGNGAWSLLGPSILRFLGFDVSALFCQPDGTFPNRPPDCARTKNLAALRAAVVESGAAVGIAWDGDGDRVAFVDENGAHASADEISILMARRALEAAAPGEGVVCDIKLSDAVCREVLRCGGVPLLERSGHAFMRSRLLKERALLGLDACGHFFFREAGSRDDGLYSALFLLGMLEEGRTLGEMRRSAGPLFSTPELRIPATLLGYSVVVERLRAAFPGAEELALDGARLTLADGILLARESSTEPMVSLRVDAFNQRGYEKLVGECLASLGEAGALLRRQIEESAQ